MITGIRALIGASFIATGSYKCSGTMAAYLTRNHSRFQYSHNFAYVNLKDFHNQEPQDYTIDGTNDGTPFIKSSVEDYIFRSEEWEDVCLYDMLSNYSLKKTNHEENELVSTCSQSQRYMKYVKKKEGFEAIPKITFLHFVNTSKFEGKNIGSCDLSLCTESKILQ